MSKFYKLSKLHSIIAAFLLSAFCASAQIIPEPVYLIPEHQNTGNMCNIYLQLDSRIPNGYEFGVWTESDMLVGSGAAYNGIVNIKVWGDNGMTPNEVDGALPDELLTVKAFDTTAQVFRDMELTNMRDIVNEISITEFRYDINALFGAFCLIPYVGINEEVPQLEISFYPNPAKDIITLRLNEAGIQSDITVDIINQIGVVEKSFDFGFTNKEISIDLNGLAKGIYFLRLNSSNQIKITPLVIQ